MVESRSQDTVDTVAFVLRAADGGDLPSYKPGQYLSVKVQVPGQSHVAIRQYSLSAPSNNKTFRIAVRREQGGAVSEFLQDKAQAGSELLVHMPQGDMVLSDSDRPVVLLSSGSCITPMTAMVESLKDSRAALFVHATRDADHHAFKAELDALAKSKPHVRLMTLYNERLSIDRLRSALPQGDCEYYVSGSDSFMKSCDEMLNELQVPHARRFAERFGPSQSFDVVIPRG